MLNILQCTQDRTSPLNTLQRIFQSKMSTAQKLRNLGIEKRKRINTKLLTINLFLKTYMSFGLLSYKIIELSYKNKK